MRNGRINCSGAGKRESYCRDKQKRRIGSVMQDKKKESKVKIIRWTNMELECFYGDYVEAVAYARKKAAETGQDYIIT